MSILEEEIKDKRFTDLIRKALNAGHFNYFGVRSRRHASNFTFKGLRSLLYPILIDIFFLRLDNYVFSLADQFNRNLSNECRDSSGAKLSYVRAEDQIILGLKGTYSEGVNIINLLVDFFEHKLSLKVPKEAFEIIDLSKKKQALSISFLGVRLSILDIKPLSFNRTIMLTAPIDNIISKLTKAGFLKDKKPIPKLI